PTFHSEGTIRPEKLTHKLCRRGREQFPLHKRGAQPSN
ncbi:hypothetical protein RSAG8_01969, partial [Rhizoctonia solani AG-8 WAC10335]